MDSTRNCTRARPALPAVPLAQWCTSGRQSRRPRCARRLYSAGQLSSTVPAPLPLAPAVIVSHDVDVVAVHPHPSGAVTGIRTASPASGTACSDDDRLTRQGAASCSMRTLTPLTTSCVCLATLAWFVVTSKWSVPLPCPDEGSTRATQVASAPAVHAHSGVVTSATSPLPPVAAIGDAGGESVTEHFTGVGAVDVTAVEPQPPSRAATARVVRVESRRGFDPAAGVRAIQGRDIEDAEPSHDQAPE